MSNFSFKKKFLIIAIPILTIFIGFILNEDLSTGGSKLDFYQTFPVVENFTNSIFNDIVKYTRHFPLHYFILSIPQFLFQEILITKIFYLFFSLLIPIFIYLNLCKLYPKNNVNNLIVSFAILFIPYLRASSIWPNAHLTAIIFLLISNYYFLIYVEKKKFFYIFLNIFFLSLATYSIQSYSVFFLFYLFEYYKKVKFINFIYILILCSFFSIPGFYLILKSSLGSKLAFTSNFAYTILTNFSIIFFFILFFLSNKKNFLIVKNFIKKIRKIEIILISIFFIFLIINFKNLTPGVGGGFFYKVSFFIFKNEIIFFIASFLALFSIYLIFKEDKKLFFLIFLSNFSSIAYYTSQKYFEPLMIFLILTISKNFLTHNMITNKDGTVKFYGCLLIYFLLALINSIFSISKNVIY